MRYTIKDFQKEFSTDEKCLHFIFTARWQEGGFCKCGRTDCFHPVTGRKSYACAWCGHQISPTAGTIFHKSPTPLRLWFFAIFLMSTSKNGVAAKELERQLGVTYKTAWRMAHQIRKLMDQPTTLMKGVIEADETFIGGLAKNMHENKRKTRTGGSDKTVVAGVMERGGDVRATVVTDTKAVSILPQIVASVAKGATVCTDESASYSLTQYLGYTHATVNHGAGEFVKARVHTNSIEGFWSQLKRSINGTFHQVSKIHLQSYVNEFCYRYNRRKDVRPLFHALSEKVGLQVPARKRVLGA